MFSIICLNPIAGKGLEMFADDYKKAEDLKDAMQSL